MNVEYGVSPAIAAVKALADSRKPDERDLAEVMRLIEIEEADALT